MGLIEDNKINTPSPIVFVLQAYGKLHVCDPLPIEWKECVKEVSRDTDSGGISNTLLVDKLTFVGSGAKFLKDILDTKEATGECNLKIGFLKDMSYTYSTYKIDFTSYAKVKIGDKSIGLRFNCINTSATQKLLDRSKVNLNILSTETIGGVQLTDSLTGAKTKVRFPELKSSFAAKYSSRLLYKNDPHYDLQSLSKGVNSVPLSDFTSDFSEAQRVQFRSGQAKVTDLQPLFISSSEDKTLTLAFDLYFHVDEAFGSWLGGYKNAVAVKYAIYNGQTLVSSANCPAVAASVKNPLGDDKGQKRVFGSFDLQLKYGESLYLYVEVTRTDGNIHFVRPKTKTPDKEFGTSVSITQTVVNTPEVVLEGVQIHDFWQRLAALILDDQWAFYSEFFGLTDAPYFQDQTTGEYLYYTSENQERFAHIFAGTNIRGLALSSANAAINTNFEEAFKSLSAMYCLGYAIEQWTYGGVVRERLRIEPLSFFFQNEMSVDISGRISELDIEESYMNEYAYVQILGGYKNFVFQNANGRGEYNTEVTRSTILSTEKDLELQSEFAASTIMFVNCLKKPMETTGSEDIDEDDKILVLKTQRDTRTPSINSWKPEAQENMIIENDSSLFGASSLNLFFTPYWNLYRNAQKIVIALQKQLSSKIKFRTSTKTSNLETTYNGITVSENSDMIVGNLPAPLIDPFELLVTCTWTQTDEDAYLAKPYGYLKLTSLKSGYVKKKSWKLAENKATFVLIKKH